MKTITHFLKYALLCSVVMGVTSCGTDDNPKPGNDPKPEVKAPEKYIFERNSTSTVSYSGQTERIAMSGEISDAFKKPEFTKDKILAMFKHVKGGQDFANTSLNDSDKNVRSKVAASTDFFFTNSTDAETIKKEFDDFIMSQANEVFPAWNTEASAGNAGKIADAANAKFRYVNAKGLELDQMFAKSLIGGLMADQILNTYLSPAVLDAGSNKENNTKPVLVDGKNYTEMEHKWDEAYGYLYGAEADGTLPKLKADKFLNNYLAGVDANPDFTGIAKAVFDAFKLGRAAIVAGDYELRDKQADIIKENLSKVIAVRAVHYIAAGKAELSKEKADYYVAFHALSEGLGFVNSLQFTRKPGTAAPYLTRAEVQEISKKIYPSAEGKNGFWSVTPQALDEAAKTIAGKFGFTTEQAAK